MSITIQVNGDSHVCPGGLGFLALLEELNFNPRLIAVEYNGEILHRQFWANTRLDHGDRLEIVTIVGGG